MSDSIQDNMKEQMDAARQALSRNLATIRAGRANPTILDNVYVDYYGANTPLNQIAAITAPEARQLLITPYDKSALQDIEKAIQKADLGLSPANDGKVIRINIPALTEERRKDLVKVVGKYAEEAKVQVRNVRREANDKLKKAEKNSDISKDELKGLQENVQKSTDNYIEQIDQHAKDKEKEIMEV